MQIFARCALGLALAMQAANAQIRLPSLPITLPPQPLQNTTQLLDQTGSRTLQKLSDLRLVEITRLARANPRDVELDPDGQPIVRSEILMLAPAQESLERALAAGFTVARDRGIDALGIRVVVLNAPAGLATKKALRRLREADPEGTYDYNHIYLGSGAARSGDTQPVPATEPAARAPAGRAALRVGLIDTGIDDTHPAFAAASIHRWGCEQKPVPAGHGTAVASLLVGPSAAQLYAADVYCGAPTGGAVDVLAAAFGWMVQENIPVINVSLVGPKNALLQAVIARLVASGFIVVAAVGNDGPAAPPLYPASYPHVVGVTAVDGRHKVLIEAARGPQVMFAAIGADTAAADASHGYAAVRGTSFAAPIVAGLLAAAMEKPDAAQANAALQALQEQAVHLGPAGRNLTYGFGLVGLEETALPSRIHQ